LSEARPCVAVIGGGASGTLTALALLTQPAGPDVIVAEPRATLGHGVAYSTSDMAHRLNVAAGMMSAFPDRPDHFVEWGATRLASFTTFSFAPRAMYGSYLTATLREAAGDRLLHVQACATSLRRDGNGFAVQLDRGGSLRADHVVLALGHASAASLPVLETGLAGDHGYAADPWADEALRTLPRGTALLVGSGLTAVDVALSLADRDPAARIVALSRNGLRPLDHRSGGAAESPPVVSALRPKTALGLLRAVRAEVALAAEQDGDWRDVVNRLRPTTQQIWQSLPAREKLRFQRRLARFWEVHRHRMAPEVAARIAELERDGRLRFVAGRLSSAARRGDRIAVVADLRGGHRIELETDAVVNCTGTQAGIRQHALLARLEAAGLCAPGPLGLGVATDGSGRVLDRSGRATGIYTLGPLRRGELWETIAIPEIRAQACALAEHIARSREPVVVRAAI
jgi:uncharacterized NAD(P)/FAD-binding protein YdhS